MWQWTGGRHRQADLGRRSHAGRRVVQHPGGSAAAILPAITLRPVESQSLDRSPHQLNSAMYSVAARNQPRHRDLLPICVHCARLLGPRWQSRNPLARTRDTSRQPPPRAAHLGMAGTVGATLSGQPRRQRHAEHHRYCNPNRTLLPLANEERHWPGDVVEAEFGKRAAAA